VVQQAFDFIPQPHVLQVHNFLRQNKRIFKNLIQVLGRDLARVKIGFCCFYGQMGQGQGELFNLSVLIILHQFFQQYDGLVRGAQHEADNLVRVDLLPPDRSLGSLKGDF